VPRIGVARKTKMSKTNEWPGFGGRYINAYPVYARPSPGLLWRKILLLLALMGCLVGSTAVLTHLRANSLVSYGPVPGMTQASPATMTSTSSINNDSHLQSILNNWQQSHGDHQWSVAVKGLGADSRQAALAAGNKYETASTFKLYLLYTLFQSHTLASLDSINIDVEGRDHQTVKQCVDLMIRVSDNPCGEAVGNFIGWNKANTNLKKIGLTGTNINDPAGNPTTTAGDMELYLSQLSAGKLLPDDAQSYVLGLMQQQKFRQGIPAGCAGCTGVANKVGDLGTVRNDAAIIDYPDGKYVLAIYTNGASYGQIAQLTSQINDYMITPKD
jgi:hypothetical protein